MREFWNVSALCFLDINFANHTMLKYINNKITVYFIVYILHITVYFIVYIFLKY